MNLDLRTIPAIYINLKKDIKKDFEMKTLMVDFGFKNVIRVEGNLTPERPLAGCSLSHYNALHEVDPPFIIFEDDCVIKNKVNKIQKTRLLINIYFKIIILGYKSYQNIDLKSIK